VPPGTPPAPGQIIASNALAVAALLRSHGAEVDDLGIAPDRIDALAAAIDRARGHDLLVTIGGASVGDHDLVKPALEAAGARLDFWKVALRPGKPLMAGRLGAQLVAGLPGNPVSAFVCARLFLVPLIRRLAGNPEPLDTPLTARTTVALAANGPRRDFMRATLAPGAEGWTVTPAAAQDSSLAAVLAGADALLVRPERGPALPVGAPVPVLRL
jgi:molybdopterin molybdotransferase